MTVATYNAHMFQVKTFIQLAMNRLAKNESVFMGITVDHDGSSVGGNRGYVFGKFIENFPDGGPDVVRAAVDKFLTIPLIMMFTENAVQTGAYETIPPTLPKMGIWPEVAFVGFPDVAAAVAFQNSKWGHMVIAPTPD